MMGAVRMLSFGWIQFEDVIISPLYTRLLRVGGVGEVRGCINCEETLLITYLFPHS